MSDSAQKTRCSFRVQTSGEFLPDQGPIARSSQRLTTKPIRPTKRRPRHVSSASTAGARPQASRSATTAPDNGGGGLARETKGNPAKIRGETLKIARGSPQSDPWRLRSGLKTRGLSRLGCGGCALGLERMSFLGFHGQPIFSKRSCSSSLAFTCGRREVLATYSWFCVCVNLLNCCVAFLWMLSGLGVAPLQILTLL